MNVSASFSIASRVSGDGPAVRAALPVVDAEAQPRHRDVVRDVLLLLRIGVGVDAEALDGLRVEAAEKDRGGEPDRDDRAQRPQPARERPGHEERAGETGQQRQDVIGEEPAVGVREGDAGRDARLAVDELVLVQLVAERDAQQVQAGDDREVDTDPRDEHLAATGRGQQVARAGDRERGQEQPVDQRLDEAQERQVEQEEADVAAEDRVRDARGRRERHAVEVQHDRVPRARRPRPRCRGRRGPRTAPRPRCRSGRCRACRPTRTRTSGRTPVAARRCRSRSRPAGRCARRDAARPAGGRSRS